MFALQKLTFGQFKRLPFNVKSMRYFFSREILGMDKYEKERYKTLNELGQSPEEFKDHLKKVLADTRNIPLTIIKKACYVLGPKDLELYEEALRKYAMQEISSSIQFKIFTLDPLIMRLYYHFNKPIEAMSIVEDSQTSSLFRTFKSYLILQDLLYENGLYNEVYKIFHLLQEKQIGADRFPAQNYLLFQAACYKENSQDSFAKAKSCLQDLRSISLPMIVYTLILALKQNEPQLALQHVKVEDNESLNIKIAALIQMGNFSGALALMNHSISKLDEGFAIIEDNWRSFERIVQGTGNREILTGYNDIKTKLGEEKLLNMTLEDIAEKCTRKLLEGKEVQRKRRPSFAS